MNENTNRFDPLQQVTPPEQWDAVLNRLNGFGHEPVISAPAEPTARATRARRMAPLAVAASIVAVAGVAAWQISSGPPTTNVTLQGTPNGSSQPAGPGTGSDTPTIPSRSIAACTLTDSPTVGSGVDRVTIAPIKLTDAPGKVMLIDRVGQHGNPSGQHGKPAGWVVSGLLGEYQVEVGVGNRSVSEAPEDSGLGTASWSFALNGQGELLTRSFVVDGIAGTTSSMIADLPAEILLSPQDGTSPDGSSVPNGFSDEDCGTAVAAMAPVDLTVAVAGPDIQYAAQVALRVGNVLAGLE